MEVLFQGLLSLSWQSVIMMVVGGALILLAIKKNYEPMLLLPIGFGAILVNLPLAAVWEFGGEPGVLQIFHIVGIATEIFPVLIFVAVGAMIDFSVLIKNPKMLFLGAAAQFGIFATIVVVVMMSGAFYRFFEIEIDLKMAASIGIIGTADGPTSILVANRFAPVLVGPIAVAAYSYMALVPIIQPPIIKALTTKKERLMRMDYSDRKISKTALIMFPIITTIVAGILAPVAVPLVGLLMFGNLIKVSGVLERLSNAAQNELANLVTLLLGITIGSTMHYDQFLRPLTLMVLALGLAAFMFNTVGGIIFVKVLNLFSKNKINPMIGAAGISAFPMSARLVQKMAAEEDPTNFILMPAVSANVAGQVASAIAGGMVLAIVPQLLQLI